MDASSLVVIASLVAVSTVIGLIWRARQGAVSSDADAHVPISLVSPGHKLTLLQVSSPLCSYCHAMRTHLSRFAQDIDDVAHVDYDVSEIPQLVERLKIRQTPTTLFVEADGKVAHQVAGPLAPPAIGQLIDDTLADVRKRADEYEI